MAEGRGRGGRVRPVAACPNRLTKGAIHAEWRFIPSADLGGDTFGYDWLDDEHFAFYLLDVSGHGVGAALLSVSALNALRSQSLPADRLPRPGPGPRRLNSAFQMDQQNGLFFTIWYGVFDHQNRRIAYCGGGHPPAILLSGPADAERSIHVLDSTGLAIGMFPDIDYEAQFHTLGDGPQSLFFYSDGVYELIRPDGSMWSFDAFADFMKTPVPAGASQVDRAIAIARRAGKDDFVDDFSVVEVRLQ